MRWLLIVPLLVLLALFALSNRQEVLFGLWPFDLRLALPLGVAVLLFGALSFLLGALVTWLAALPHRRRARQVEEAHRLLAAEFDEHRAREAKRAEARERAMEEAAGMPPPVPIRLTTAVGAPRG